MVESCRRRGEEPCQAAGFLSKRKPAEVPLGGFFVRSAVGRRVASAANGRIIAAKPLLKRDWPQRYRHAIHEVSIHLRKGVDRERRQLRSEFNSPLQHRATGC